jgi:hypothetical protein
LLGPANLSDQLAPITQPLLVVASSTCQPRSFGDADIAVPKAMHETSTETINSARIYSDELEADGVRHRIPAYQVLTSPNPLRPCGVWWRHETRGIVCFAVGSGG